MPSLYRLAWRFSTESRSPTRYADLGAPRKRGAFFGDRDDTCAVKIVGEEILISCGPFPKSAEWKTARDKLHKAIRAVEWPPKSGKFTIYPESGKKRGMGNGVKPIKVGL